MITYGQSLALLRQVMRADGVALKVPHERHAWIRFEGDDTWYSASLAGLLGVYA